MSEPCILVTGGAGFIGSALVRRLLAGGRRVVTVDSLTYAGSLDRLSGAMANPRHRFVQADVNERDRIAAILAEEGVTGIAHLAAETHVDRSIDSAEAFLQANVAGSLRLLEAATVYWRGLDESARPAFRFLMVSTDEVFGDLGPGDPPFDESSPYRPSSPYAASKAAADHLARAFGRTHGLPVVVTHCTNNFGPFQYPEKLIPLTILNLLEGREARVYGSGAQVRDWLHVDDHARALVQLLDRGVPGQGYAVSAMQERSNLEVVLAICDALDTRQPLPSGQSRRSLVRHVEDRPGHDARYALNPARMARDFGWTAERGFDEALAETIAWYCDHPQWWRPIRERAYAGDRLGAPR